MAAASTGAGTGGAMITEGAGEGARRWAVRGAVIVAAMTRGGGSDSMFTSTDGGVCGTAGLLATRSVFFVKWGLTWISPRATPADEDVVALSLAFNFRLLRPPDGVRAAACSRCVMLRALGTALSDGFRWTAVAGLATLMKGDDGRGLLGVPTIAGFTAVGIPVPVGGVDGWVIVRR